MLSRRQALSNAAKLVSALAIGAIGKNIADAASANSSTASPAKGRVPYGACLRPDIMDKDPRYQATLKNYCQQITPEGGMYWADLRPTRQEFNFDKADSILAFADENGMTMRGHTLVWYGAMPSWTKEISNAAEAERELTTHVEQVVSRYRGKVKTWHVVNEPIDETTGPFPGLRPCIWLQHLGEKYIDLSFHAAHRADPSAELILNEYDIEGIDRTSPKRRMAFFKLIRDLLSRGVPLHGVGIQAHIRAKNQIDRDGVINFIADIRARGLSVHVTELDVIDYDLPGPVAVRDAVIAARVHDLLEPIFAITRPAVISTWGITDRYSWVPTYFKRNDGLGNRPLPFDENYRPKPMWNVIDYFCQKTA